MAPRSIFVLTILSSLVLVSCGPSRSSHTATEMAIRACMKTSDFRFCVSNLKVNQRSIAAADPRALVKVVTKRALSKVDEATAYIEKVFYEQQDMVVKEYLALCLDDYAKAGKKLKQIQYILTSSQNSGMVPQIMGEIADHATDCQEAFERKKLQSEVNYRPPRPCPLSLQNKSIQLMAEAAARLLG